MTDHELEQRLRTWYRAEVADEVAPASLYAILPEITQAAAPASTLRRRAFLLLAAALLLAATAAAVGSGLIRLPRLPDVSTPTWLSAGTTITTHSDHTATALQSGMVLIAGGLLGDQLEVTELFDPVSLSWNRTGDLSQAHGETTATLLSDGRVLLAGVGRAEVYDPRTGAWTTTAPMLEERYGHTATLLPDGQVLVAGGQFVPADKSEGAIFGGAELFDPTTGTWERTGSMNVVRLGHTATLLPNGLVLVIGGNSDPSDETTAAAELYDPGTGTWTETGPMHLRRGAHTATLLASGLVLVSGGRQGDLNELATPLSSAELYDPTTGAWTSTGQLDEGRAFHEATALEDGTVLVTGGAVHKGPDALASTERYDPPTGRWLAGPSMAHPRLNHTATLLFDGSVLVVGGVTNAAEIYRPESGR
jgi:Kelch motif/Galactose oxidase, central domain